MNRRDLSIGLRMLLILLSLFMTCVFFYEHNIPQGLVWVGLTMAWGYLLFERITEDDTEIDDTDESEGDGN